MSQLLNIKQVAAYFGVHEHTIYRWMKVYCFPQPKKRVGSPRWAKDEIEGWLDRQPSKNPSQSVA